MPNSACRTVITAFVFLFVYQVPLGAETISGVVKNFWVAKYPILVYVDEIPGKTFTPPSNPPKMDQVQKEFVPRILPVLVGSTVEFLNSDDMEHNVFSPDNEGYNLGNARKGQVLGYTFKSCGVYTQLCKIHPEMVAYVVVVPTPYTAITDSAGNFRIENVPPGNYTLRVWGERLKPKQIKKEFHVTVESGKDTQVEIKP